MAWNLKGMKFCWILLSAVPFHLLFDNAIISMILTFQTFNMLEVELGIGKAICLRSAGNVCVYRASK